MAPKIALPLVPARKPRTSKPPSTKAVERAAEFELLGRQLHFRFSVIQARMQAHGINWTYWLGLKMLAHSGLETWLGAASSAVDVVRRNPHTRGEYSD